MESDRVSALLEMLGALGGRATTEDDSLLVTGGPLRGGTVGTRHDHRIAMAASVAALVSDTGVTLDDPGCVRKSYPRFFEDLSSLGGRQ
jgi:3-phosphoshikimate 1-carboxyvinyltransferase